MIIFLRPCVHNFVLPHAPHVRMTNLLELEKTKQVIKANLLRTNC